MDERSVFVDELVSILAKDVRRLRFKDIPIVKVQWRHRPVEEANWETEHDMRAQYPYLFKPSGISLSFTFVDKSPFSSGC